MIQVYSGVSLLLHMNSEILCTDRHSLGICQDDAHQIQIEFSKPVVAGALLHLP